MLCPVSLAVQTHVPSRVSLSVQVGKGLGSWVAGRTWGLCISWGCRACQDFLLKRRLVILSAMSLEKRHWSDKLFGLKYYNHLGSKILEEASCWTHLRINC